MKTSWWMRAGVITAALVLCASLTHAQGDDPLVTNVQAQQRQFSALVDVTYDLETTDGIAVMVHLSLSTDAGTTYPYLCQAVTGDVGPGVLPGTNRHIVWDAGVDFPGFSSPTCRLRVTARDSEADFVYISPGMFTMGSPPDEPLRNPDEMQHDVTLTHGIFVQTTEVTNQQYMELAQWAYDHGHATATSSELRDNLDGSTQVLKHLGSGYYEISFSGGVFSCINPDHPVKWVTWYGSVAYCDWLSLQQGLARAYDHATWQCNGGQPYTAAGYRLPTEAEWEYTCRAGSTTAFANGPITQIGCSPVDPNLDQMGWYCGNAGSWTHPVAQKMANALGLYDMHGNLLEWCNDRYGAYGGPVTDPVGPEAGNTRVFRGGFWLSTATDCRSACRLSYYPGYAGNFVGFRPVRSFDSEADFVYIPPGTFTMGSPTDEPGRESDETQHQVTLTHGIYVQTTEVTNQQYMELAQWAYDHNHVTVVGDYLFDNLDGSNRTLKYLGGAYNPEEEVSFSDGVFNCTNPDHPTKRVSWYGSVAYCDWLSLQQGLPRAYNHGTWQCNNHDPYNAQGYRLPTEAEWEYACRADSSESSTAFANGPITYPWDCTLIDPNLDLMGWYCGNTGGWPDGWTRPVAQKLPNGWGLHDMHGNLYEWCNDWYASYGGAVMDPVGPGTGSYRVLRGGSWDAHAQDCRSALRNFSPGVALNSNCGFRPVRSAN